MKNTPSPSTKPGLYSQVLKPSCRFYDLKHTSILEYRYYALGKLKNHGIIRIDYTIRDGQIRLINAFKAGEADRERYYTGEEDF